MPKKIKPKKTKKRLVFLLPTCSICGKRTFIQCWTEERAKKKGCIK